MSWWKSFKSLFDRRYTVRELLEFKPNISTWYTLDTHVEDHLIQLLWRKDNWDLDAQELQVINLKIEQLEYQLQAKSEELAEKLNNSQRTVNV